MPATTRPWIAIDHSWVRRSIQVQQQWMWEGETGGVPFLIFAGDDHGQWPPAPNPTAGVRETAWLRQHRSEVADAQAPWVAILRDRVIYRGSSFTEVFAQLKASSTRDALVACVHPRRSPRPFRIA